MMANILVDAPITQVKFCFVKGSVGSDGFGKDTNYTDIVTQQHAFWGGWTLMQIIDVA